MATLPPKACSKPMCPNMQSPTGRGYCTVHATDRPKYTPSKSKTESDRFYDRVRWRNVRHTVLMMEPLCRICFELEIASEATVVDHIVRRSHGGAEYDKANLMPLCKPCHDRKTRREQQYYDNDTYNTTANEYLRYIRND